ncbi:MAG: hypothetical protein JWM63_5155 [Gammaproteobacteria bacterium]|nr:hypothetical protein [Gammaproteobacteria bacterium]
MPLQLQKAASPDEACQAPDGGVTMRLRALRTRAEPTTPVEAAAALIELSLHESNAPVEQLSGALVRIAQSLQGGTGDFQRNRDLLAGDLAVCIESLQFHDRLTQQLTQVRNLLASLAFSDMHLDSAGRLLPGDTDTWHILLENLRARFTSDSHRILFNLLLPGAGPRTGAPSLHANEGSVELF